MDGHRKVLAAARGCRERCCVAAPGAYAQRAASVGPGTPWGATGIQLYDFNNYLSSGNGQVGAGEITCPAPPAPATPNCVGPPAPTTQAARLERVLAVGRVQGHPQHRSLQLSGQPVPDGDRGQHRQHRRDAGAAGDG